MTDRGDGPSDNGHADAGLDYLERCELWRGRVRDDVRDVYDTMLGENLPPRHAAATLDYLVRLHGDRGYKTQSEVADDYDVSMSTISRRAHRFADSVRERVSVPDPDGDGGG